MRRETENPD